MKEPFFLNLCLVLTGLSGIATGCSDDKAHTPDDEVRYGTMGTHDLIVSSDGKTTVSEHGGVYWLEIPAEGGTFEFSLGEKAVSVSGNKSWPIKSFPFKLHACCEYVWDSPTVPRNQDEAEGVAFTKVSEKYNDGDDNVECPFGIYTSRENGFSITVYPNRIARERSFPIYYDVPMVFANAHLLQLSPE